MALPVDGNTTPGSVERPEDMGKDGPALWRYWMHEVDNAGRVMEPWVRETDRICKIYKSESSKSARSGENFNILAANINTARPALYNSTPIPDIRKRYADRDIMVDPNTLRDAAAVMDRAVAVNLEDGAFDDAMKSAVVDMLQGGRGVVRIRDEALYDDSDELAWYRCCIQRVPWKDFRHQPEADWRDVNWIAFRLYLDRDELEKLSPVGSKVRLDHTTNSEGSTYGDDDADESDIRKRACVWEIWDKRKRERLFIATSYRRGPIKREDDPWRLESFFPVPKPIFADLDPDSLIPLPDYRLYEDQARELNRITKRIQKVVEIIKWRGIYSDQLQAVATLGEADDGELKPVQMPDPNANLDHSVWLMPIDRAIMVVEKLYMQRAQIIDTIYQITGLSDIIRGNSDPNETLGAQRIKAQWAAGRFSLRQSEVAMMARNSIRLMVEMLVTQCTPQVLSVMSGIQVTPEIQQLISSDQLRMWKLDIETDSTIQADLSDARQNIGEMIQGMGGFVQAMAPLVEGGIMPKDAAVKLLSAFTRPFRLGRQAEIVFDELIEQMESQKGQPQQPDPAAMQAQAEAQAEQAKLQIEAQKAQADDQNKKGQLQVDAQHKQQQIAIDKGRLAIEWKKAKFDMAMEADNAKFERKMRVTEAAQAARSSGE